MRPEAKRMKIASIITMFAGIACAIAGIVLAVRGSGIGGVLAIVCGICSAVVGVRGSLLANVPSTAEKIVMPSLVAGLLCLAFAFAVGLVVEGSGPLETILCAAPAILCGVVSLCGQAVKKALEKI